MRHAAKFGCTSFCETIVHFVQSFEAPDQSVRFTVLRNEAIDERTTLVYPGSNQQSDTVSTPEAPLYLWRDAREASEPVNTTRKRHHCIYTIL